MTDSEYIEVPLYPKLVNKDTPEGKRSFVSKIQVTGWRFLMQRAAASITEGSVTPYTEPLFTYHRMFTLGLISTCLGVIVCFIYSLINPAAIARNNTVVEDAHSHSFYVITDNILHPVYNLTSARLILGQPAEPIKVKSEELRKFPLGDKLGIADAPDMLGVSAHDKGLWQVCDHQTQVWVFHPQNYTPPEADLESDGAIVSNHRKFWLVWDHYRSRLPHLNRELLHSLGFTGQLVDAPPISDHMLNMIPQRADYVAPRIAHYGAPINFTVSKYPSLKEHVHIGSIIQTPRSVQPPRFFITENTGIQEIPSTIAALFRLAHPNSTYVLPSADWLFNIPTAREIDTSQYPDHVLGGINSHHQPYLCMLWQQPNTVTQPQQILYFTSELPPGTAIHQAVPNTNTVFEGLTGHVVELSNNVLRGNGQEDFPQGSTFWISSSGVRYGLPQQYFHSLGIGEKPVLIPWSVLTLYSSGTALSKENALTVDIEQG